MKALLFARLRELAGTDAAEASGSTVGEAWESLRRRFPGLPANPDGIRAGSGGWRPPGSSSGSTTRANA